MSICGSGVYYIIVFVSINVMQLCLAVNCTLFLSQCKTSITNKCCLRSIRYCNFNVSRPNMRLLRNVTHISTTWMPQKWRPRENVVYIALSINMETTVPGGP